jgi:hypothetical protein
MHCPLQALHCLFTESYCTVHSSCLYCTETLPTHRSECLLTVLHCQFNAYSLTGIAYTLSLRWLFTAYSLSIHCLCAVYCMTVQCLSNACVFTGYIHCLSNVCSLPIRCLCTAYSLPIRCRCTAYSLPMHCPFTAYSHLLISIFSRVDFSAELFSSSSSRSICVHRQCIGSA